MITTKQRATLRGMANGLEPILHMGREGLSENVLAQAEDSIRAREIFKGTVQKNCEMDARQAAHGLAAALGADVVQVIGRRFVLYRRNEENPIIEL